ncbi:hypothetical protein Hanom_Chr11g01054471 [Helianthus anomalus]
MIMATMNHRNTNANQIPPRFKPYPNHNLPINHIETKSHNQNTKISITQITNPINKKKTHQTIET